MWRKQDQPKSSSVASETGVPEAVEAPGPATATTPVPKSSVGLEPAGSRLTAALKIKGEITGKEDLLVDAEVEGSIQLDAATLTIGPSGRIAADLEASDIVVHGKVQGSLLAAERVRVTATGNTRGTITSQRLSVEGGAEIHGRVETIRTEEPSALRPTAPTTEEIAVPKPVPAATSHMKEPSAAA
jgi:cytoskeletal protein CcmA (bactofilin family)